MAWAQAIAQGIQMTVQQIGAYKQGEAVLEAGRAAHTAGLFKKEQLDQRAKAKIAISHRTAKDFKEKMDIERSRIVALTAASGGGALDPNVVDMLANLTAKKEMGAANILADFRASAEEDVLEGKVAEYEGRLAKRASRLSKEAIQYGAAGTSVGQAGSMFSKYGGSTAGRTASTKTLDVGAGYRGSGGTVKGMGGM